VIFDKLDNLKSLKKLIKLKKLVFEKNPQIWTILFALLFEKIELKLRALHSELFSEIRVEFRVGTSFSRVETRRVERHFFRYFQSLFFRIFRNSRKGKLQKKAIFASSEMFEKLGNYQNISEIWKTAISETRENKNFGKKHLTHGLTQTIWLILLFEKLKIAIFVKLTDA